MRSLLFVPADSPKKLDKAMTSGADALIIDLEDSVAFDGKAKARDSAAAFLKSAMPVAPRPYIMVRVNALQTGLTDADLDAIAPAKPDAIMLPKAEGGASIMHADAKLSVREASQRSARRAHQNHRHRHRNRGFAFCRRHLCGIKRTFKRADLGRRGPFRRARGANQSRRQRQLSRSLPAGAGVVPCRRSRSAGTRDRHRLC